MSANDRVGQWEKAIRIIGFSGEEEKWNEWKSKFLVKAKSGGYRDLLLGKVTAPDEGATGYDYSNLSDAAKAALKANEDGFDALTLACKGIAHELVASAVTSAHPDGNAREAWVLLSKTYEDDTMATRISLKAEFDNCRMASNYAHPNEWFTELDKIKL